MDDYEPSKRLSLEQFNRPKASVVLNTLANWQDLAEQLADILNCITPGYYTAKLFLDGVIEEEEALIK